MRTQQHSKSTDPLGRYYTSEAVSRFLVEQLPVAAPGAIIDLGSGDGALSVAASARWEGSSLITVDLDKANSLKLIEKLSMRASQGRHAHMFVDALSADLPSKLPRSNLLGLEAGVCNPPFLVPRWRKEYGEILESAGLSRCFPKIATTDASVIFLAQNLRLLAKEGVLGIIVPDSLVNAEKYVAFRRELLTRYCVEKAIRLPRGSFGGTDALAHIVIVRNGPPGGDVVELQRLNDDLTLLPAIRVDVAAATERLDHGYHFAKSTTSGSNTRLSSACIDLRRGSLNSAQVRSASGFVLHTTHISDRMCGKWVDFSARRFRPPLYAARQVQAMPGDIVIGRVGRTASRKIIGVSGGSVVLSDCLFRLRVAEGMGALLLGLLTSHRGREWLERHAYGVAAMQLTKKDLLNFPIGLA